MSKPGFSGILGWDGIETMSRIWEIAPDLQIVLCTAYSTDGLAEIIEKTFLEFLDEKTRRSLSNISSGGRPGRNPLTKWKSSLPNANAASCSSPARQPGVAKRVADWREACFAEEP